MKVHNFKELKVWQKAMELAQQVYTLSAFFPKEERFGLVTQVQRAAVSVPFNLAEGCGRVTDKELQHFVSIAMGSCFELETQMIFAFRVAYITEDNLRVFQELVSEVQRMLYGFYNRLNKI